MGLLYSRFISKSSSGEATIPGPCFQGVSGLSCTFSIPAFVSSLCMSSPWPAELWVTRDCRCPRTARAATELTRVTVLVLLPSGVLLNSSAGFTCI